MTDDIETTDLQTGATERRRFWNRRRFLAAMGGAVVLLGGGVVLGRYRVMDWRIRRHFSYLNIAPQDALRFVRDYEKAYGELPFYRRSAGDVYKKFLMSTDFFPNGADESRPLRYIMLYDPYISPCYNPLKTPLEA